MAEVKLYDTLTRELHPLRAEDGKRFRMYVCGPTVYGPAHIGNFLTFVRFDVVYRVLQLAALNPFYVRNITDVDDKTIRGAMAEGVPLMDFTERWSRKFHADCAALNLLKPDVEPCATAHIAEQIELVETLIRKGHAYVGGDGSVYYKVHSFCGYGKLSHFDPEALRSQQTNSAGQTNLADEYERESVADFALWKAYKEEDGDNAWESPWGRGRPGWHLECSAMSIRYLGETFDLHGGGEDLCFPHHENEIAQSEAATGKPFARHWMHGVHLLVEGKKMSKSLGNFFTLDDLCAKGFHPMEIRLALLGGHYRQQFNFTLAGIEAARSSLSKLEKAVESLLEIAGQSRDDWAENYSVPAMSSGAEVIAGSVVENAWNALCHDMNTPAALGGLHSGLKRGVKDVGNPEQAQALLRAVAALLHALGLELFVRPSDKPAEAGPVPEEVQQLAEARWVAKAQKDFAGADRMRQELAELGWNVLDTRDNYTLEPR